MRYPRPMFVALLTTSMYAQSAVPATAARAIVPAETPLGSGEYKALMEVDPSLPTHTLYHPANLQAYPGRLPIVLWGNGGCANAGNRFRWFLSDIASYGFLIVAIGPIDTKVDESLTPTKAPASTQLRTTFPVPATRTAQLIEGLNWAIAENERIASRFYHKLDPTKIAVMGQSCGGVQAIEASADPRVKTSVIWNSALLPTPNKMAGGVELTKDFLKQLHAPVAYIGGDEQDVSFAPANDDFSRITAVPVFRAFERGVPHLGTYGQPNGGEFAGVGVAWLNWQLKDDKHSASMFTGADCGLCVNLRWVVRKKGMQ